MTDPLLVDVSPWSLQSPSAWAQLAAAGPPWHGAILKASEGVGGSQLWQRQSAAWFAQHWPAVRAGGGKRYGVDFFRGAYHFLLAGHDGAAQADHYLEAIDRAGGWSVSDLFPIVDVEEGSGNRELVAARPDGVSMLARTVEAFVARVKQRTGREVVLYAGGWLRSLGLRDRLGCSWLWLAAYTPTLPAAWYEQIGFSRETLWAWQYAGSSAGGIESELAGYPRTTPVGDADISAITLPGGVERMRSLLWAERVG